MNQWHSRTTSAHQWENGELQPPEIVLKQDEEIPDEVTQARDEDPMKDNDEKQINLGDHQNEMRLQCNSCHVTFMDKPELERPQVQSSRRKQNVYVSSVW